MRATVDSRVTIDPRDNPEAWKRTVRDLTFPNPEFENLKRLGKKPFKKGKDGTWQMVPPTVTFWDENGDGTATIPRGAGTVLRKNVVATGGQMRWSDQRLALEPVGLGDLTFEPRPYQSEAVKAMIAMQQGTIVMPCGGGKTKTAIAAVCELQQPTLVVVHTKALLKQWRECCQKDLGIKAGVIGAGKVSEEPMTVATVQSLTRGKIAERFDEVTGRYGHVIIDECHHSPAKSFREVVDRMAARYRFGFTATLHRSDGLTGLIEHVMGPVIFEATYPELLAGAYLMEPEIESVTTGFSWEFEADRLRAEAKAEGEDTSNIRVNPMEYKACMDTLIEDQDRNSLIAERVCRDASAGHSTMVLTARIPHCETIAQMVCERGVAAEAVTGPMAKGKRERAMDAFEAGELPVMVATTVADEGLDVPRVSRLHLAYPTKDPGRTTQRVGRIMRTFPGKATPVATDYVDRGVSVLLNQYYQRRRVYRKFMAETLGVQKDLSL